MVRRKMEKRFSRDERGISTVIAVVSLLGLFGATMLSLDYGNMVSTRRNLITGTDATALEQARVHAYKQTGCQVGGGGTPTWQDYLLRNAGSIVPGSGVCTLHPNLAHPGTGYVVVEARKRSDTRFGGLFGLGATEPYSLSAAEYGFVTEATGLRPMGFCNVDDHVQEWLSIVDLESDGTTITPAEQTWYNALRGSSADHPTPSGSTGVIHRMWLSKTWQNGECGPGAEGNWGWMDYDCPPSCGNPSGGLSNWIRNGYDGLVGIYDGPQAECDDKTDPVSQPDGCLNGTTGSKGGSLDSDLQYLVTNKIRFHVPIFKYVADDGGNNGHFQIYGFLGVRLWAFGKQSSDDYMDFEFFELLLSGKCCSATPPSGTSNRGVKICSVDHDGDTSDATIASRCSAS